MIINQIIATLHVLLANLCDKLDIEVIVSHPENCSILYCRHEEMIAFFVNILQTSHSISCGIRFLNNSSPPMMVTNLIKHSVSQEIVTWYGSLALCNPEPKRKENAAPLKEFKKR